DETLVGLLRPDTSARLAWHQRQGHQVVLVSASLGAYLRPLAERLGLDGVLCTDGVVGADGRYTGDLRDGNCRGPEKQRRLAEWMFANGVADAPVWAYGDSTGDREMLAAAR
ncbi:MAG TPA: HAD-IB family hydrolase, partial [Ilumatobacteraceae bacterium]|nr:HAD-IB family hydrolase [Ilumatobacteraceae bacterium]